MDTKRIVLSIFKTILTICVIVVIGFFVYRMGAKAYDFGYRIFADEPLSPEPGYTMSVAIMEDKSVMEIGEILEDKGLIRNHILFYFQELFSDYHGKIQPGVYELSTAMTPQEMIEVMGSASEEEEEEDSITILSEDGAEAELNYLEEMDDSGESPDDGTSEETDGSPEESTN